MFLNLTIAFFIAITTIAYAKPIISPIDVFANSSWILAAAGTTGVLPPKDYCVNITVTDNKDSSDCVYVSLNNTVTRYKNYRIIGINERNVTKIRTVGPVVEFSDREKILELYMSETYLSTACWNPFNHKLRRYRYAVHFENVYNPNTDHLMLVGINTRSPHPEIEIALLTKTKESKGVVMKMVNTHNKASYRYFYEYDEYLPPIEIKCAIGYDEKDPKDPLNVKTSVPPNPTTDNTMIPYESSFECK